MLTAEQIAAYRDAAAMLVDPVNDYIIRDVARRVAKAGQLTSTAAYQVYRMQLMGKTKKEILARLEKELGVSEREAKKLLTQAAETGYRYDIQWLPDARVLPFAQNEPLQQIVSAAVKLAQDDFRNLTQTMGMVSRTGKALPLQEAYLEAVDDVFKRVITGAADYNTATRQACQTLYDRGLVVIDYESGVHTSLEAAVRRDMMGGLGLMQEQISAELHDQAGADGWEISAHANSAPDHEPIQGKQYSDAEYTALNNSLVRRIGTLNCGHAAFPIILGVSDPVHSPAELEAMRKANEDGVTVNGRHYTGYEATQAQRAREREIRRLRRKVAVGEELAKAAPDGPEKVKAEQTLQQSRIKLKVKEQEYKRFSNAAGLRTQNDRLMTIGYGRGQSGRARNAADANYNAWAKSIGVKESIESLAKYYDVKYNDTPRYELLKGYSNAVEKGDISPLVGFAEYESVNQQLRDKLIGVTAGNGVTVESFATHFIDRVIGQTATDHSGMRLATPVDDVYDAVKNTISLGRVNRLDDGDVRQTLHGARATVTISIRDKRLIQANPRREK